MPQTHIHMRGTPKLGCEDGFDCVWTRQGSKVDEGTGRAQHSKTRLSAFHVLEGYSTGRAQHSKTRLSASQVLEGHSIGRAQHSKTGLSASHVLEGYST